MIKKNPQINHVEETENVKWCVFKVSQYIYLHTHIHCVYIYSRLQRNVLAKLRKYAVFSKTNS